MSRPFLDLPSELHDEPHSKQSLRVWLRLLACTNMISKRIRARLRDEFDTTLPRFDILAALDRAPSGLTMSELSSFLKVSNGNVTGVVTRLIEAGLVERSPDPRDRRTVYVRITPKGHEEFAQMARIHEGWVDDLFADLSDAEIRRMLSLLGKLKESLDSKGTSEGQDDDAGDV